MDSPAILEIYDLRKTYATGVHALEGVTLKIRPGEIFGLLGPNGAGKTTLIGIVNGLVRKTSGEVKVLGKDVVSDYQFTRSKIGLVPQELNTNYFLTVEEMLDIQAGFFGVPREKRNFESILKKLGLWEKRAARGGSLSGGMKRRVMIAKALVHDPEILFLDEPTAGVDTELRGSLWDLIRSFKERNKTIILTTHYLEEAETLADRIGIINNGKLILVDDTKKLMEHHGTKLEAIYKKVVEESNQTVS